MYPNVLIYGDRIAKYFDKYFPYFKFNLCPSIVSDYDVTISQVFTRLRDKIRNVDLLVLCIGINDILAGTDVHTFSYEFASLISRVKEINPKLRVCWSSLLHFDSNVEGNCNVKINRRVDEINSAITHACYAQEASIISPPHESTGLFSKYAMQLSWQGVRIVSYHIADEVLKEIAFLQKLWGEIEFNFENYPPLPSIRDQNGMDMFTCSKFVAENRDIISKSISSTEFSVHVGGKELSITSSCEELSSIELAQWTFDNFGIVFPDQRYIVNGNYKNRDFTVKPDDRVEVQFLLKGGSPTEDSERCVLCNTVPVNSKLINYDSVRIDKNKDIVVELSKLYCRQFHGQPFPNTFKVCRNCERKARHKIPKEDSDVTHSGISASKKSKIQDVTHSGISASKKSKIQDTACFLGQFGQCELEVIDGKGFALLDVLRYFNLQGAHDITDQSVFLCRDHYRAMFAQQRTDDRMCNCCRSQINNKRSGRIVEFSKPLLDLSKVKNGIIPDNPVIGSKFRICASCNIAIHRNSECRSDQNSTALEKILQVDLEYSAEGDKIQKQNFVFHQSCRLLAQKFHDGEAWLLDDLYEQYKKDVKSVDGLRCISKVEYEEKLLSTFGDNLIVNKSMGKGSLLRWNENDIEKSLYLTLKKNRELENQRVTEANLLKAEIKCLSTGAGEPENAAFTSLVKVSEMLHKAIKIDAEDISTLDTEGLIDVSSINFKSFAEENIDPMLWNFILSLVFTEADRRKYLNNNVSWSESICDTDSKFFPVLAIVSMLMYSQSNGHCKHPLHVILADVLDKYTHSSDKCISIFNSFGMAVSDSTLKRHIASTAIDITLQPVESDLTPHSFRVCTVDNINHRSKYATVRASGEKRGFDGTTIMAVEPKPDELKMNFPNEETQFSAQAKITEDKMLVNLVDIQEKRPGLSFYQSLAVSLQFSLARSERVNGMLVSEQLSYMEDQLSISIQNLVKHDLDKNFNDHEISDYLRHEYNVKYNFDEDLGVNIDQPGRLECLSFIRLSGCALKVYELKDGEFLLKDDFTKIIPNKQDLNHKIKVFLVFSRDDDAQKRYFPLLDRERYFSSENLLPAHENLPLYTFQGMINHGLFEEVKKRNRHLMSDNAFLFPEMLSRYVKPKRSNVRSMDASLLPKEHYDISPNVSGNTLLNNPPTAACAVTSLPEKEEFSNKRIDLTVMMMSRYLFYQQNESLLVAPLKPFCATFSSKPTEKSKFKYICVLDKNADSLDTMKYVLEKLYVDMGVDQLLNYLVVVGDGKTFDYLIQLKETYSDYFSWVVPYPGDWHILKNFGLALVKVYGDSGLDQMISVLHHGATAASVTNGTDFDKTLNFFLQVYEALFRICFKKFEETETLCDSLKNEVVNLSKIWSSSLDKLKSGKSSNLTQDDFVEAFNKIKDVTKDIVERFLFYMANQIDDTIRFWATFWLRDCATYIGFYLSIRLGNWKLRNSCLKGMLPIFHVIGSKYYYRLIPKHLADMETYPQSIRNHFEDEGWVASFLGDLGRYVALDESHEMGINKDTASVIDSLSQSGLQISVLYMTARAITLKNLTDQLFKAKVETANPKLFENSLTQIAEKNIERYIERLSTPLLNLKWDIDSTQYESKLVNIFTNEVANERVHQDLTKFYYIGKEALNDYIECHILQTRLPFHNKSGAYSNYKLKTFSSNKKTTKTKDKKVIRVKGQDNLVMKSQIEWSEAHNEPVSLIDKHVHIPSAIMSNDMNGPYKGAKSKVKPFFVRHFPQAFSSDPLRVDISILEGMFIIRAQPTFPSILQLSKHNRFHITLDEYAHQLFDKRIAPYFRHPYCCKEVHVVFDSSDNSNNPKCFEREIRDIGSTLSLGSINDDTKIHRDFKWEKILSDRCQKYELIKYLCHKFIDIAVEQLKDSQQLVVNMGSGFGPGNFPALAKNKENFSSDFFMNNHQESDTLVWLHAVKVQSQKILIQSKDTDIWNIGLDIAYKHAEQEFIVQTDSIKGNYSFINVSVLHRLLSSSAAFRNVDSTTIAFNMQFLYICSGSDYTSFFRNQSKTTFTDVFMGNSDFILKNGSLYEHSDNGLHSFLKLVGCVYFKSAKSCITEATKAEEYLRLFENENQDELTTLSLWLTQIKHALIIKRSSDEDYPPSVAALKLHWLRCQWVFKVWSQANKNSIVYPNLNEYGWRSAGDSLEIIWDSESNTENYNYQLELWTKGCKCKKGCMNSCGCKRKKRYCKPGCLCKAQCFNSPPTLDSIGCEYSMNADNKLAHESLVSDNFSGGIVYEYLTDDESDSDDSEYFDDSDEEYPLYDRNLEQLVTRASQSSQSSHDDLIDSLQGSQEAKICPIDVDPMFDLVDVPYDVVDDFGQMDIE